MIYSVDIPDDLDGADHAALLADVDAHLAVVTPLRARLAALARAPQQVDRINADTLDALGVVDGKPWRQPRGAFDAYPEGWTVTHQGKTWVSLTPANVWKPGTSGWREQVTDGEYPAWVQPTGAHDAYEAGAIVTHGSQLWRSTADNNVWEPGVYGWVVHTA